MQRRWIRALNFHLVSKILLVALVALGTDCLEVLKVISTSMMPTYKDGEYLVAVSFRSICTPTYLKRLHTGDVVAVHVPVPGQTEPAVFIKRIVGVAGDHVKTVSGTLIRNGQIVQERYTDVETDRAATHFNDIAELNVPEGTVFLLGDNRRESVDSRTWGPVEESAIIGRVWFAL
jgi:signal peptidase I